MLCLRISLGQTARISVIAVEWSLEQRDFPWLKLYCI